jgi:protein TonB
MSHYARDDGDRTRRLLVLAAIGALHVLAIYQLARGVANSDGRAVQNIVQTRLLQREKPPLPPPPPPPPVMIRRQPLLQVVAPQISITLPADLPPSPPPPPPPPPPPAIQVATMATEFTPPAPAPRAVSVPTTWPRPISVPNGWERYPAESIRAKEMGEPTITICVSATGTVDSVRVSKSSGFARLDQAAVGIGWEARFKPAMKQGEPVPACMSYRIRFAINNA